MLLALQSAFGFLAIIAIAWLFSEDRRALPWRIVVSGALLQILLAAALLKRDVAALTDLVEAGHVRPVIDRSYPLAEVAEALAYVEGGSARGKVAITV